MIYKKHTRNQKRMYRIHKMEEQIEKDKYIIGKQQQELERYKNIVDEAIGIANERVNYYAHKQIEAEDWSKIFNVLIKRDN